MFPAGVPGIRVDSVTLADGTRLRAAESGDPRAPATLLVHGWGASLYMWRDWFAPLAAAGRRAVALDLPGHGLSDKPLDAKRYTLDALVRVLAEVMAVRELGAPDVVAQSMGGTTALELATRGMARLGGLVLVNPASFGRVHLLGLARFVSPRAVEPLIARSMRRWMVERAHRRVYGDPSRISVRDVDQYWATSGLPGYAAAMRRLVHEFSWGRVPVREMARRLRALAPPTSPPLVVLGARDRLVRGARAYVEALRAAGAPLEMSISSEGGHAVNEERPAEVLDVALRHLARR
ncbi:MAG TPA: alpha/beta fold hydrolase [Gemmatimonadaceae bacterium]|jgi:pimeloyl-ACP methyl ester carboxylesterase|nr:alpha/beta fold hydrolase [Gemmatimonadaceae bacterium]